MTVRLRKYKERKNPSPGLLSCDALYHVAGYDRYTGLCCLLTTRHRNPGALGT
jgi:hypothetical protein